MKTKDLVFDVRYIITKTDKVKMFNVGDKLIKLKSKIFSCGFSFFVSDGEYTMYYQPDTFNDDYEFEIDKESLEYDIRIEQKKIDKHKKKIAELEKLR